MLQTFIARWYVNGKPDIGIVSEENEELARQVVKVKLERMGVRPDRGYEKIHLRPLKPKHMQFILLSDGGRT